MDRLQKVISNCGIASRRKAEELIEAGRVKVDGKIVTQLGTQVGTNNVIEVDGTVINKEDKVYYILNKPRNVVTTTCDEHGRKTVIDLIEDDKRIYPVGRLDYDTTGLILLTNDGEFANNILHPKNEIDKVYVAKINGILSIQDLMKLKKGVLIDNKFKTSHAKVKIKEKNYAKNTSMVEISIHEGKNHQVKKMFETLGYEVIKLKREKIAFLTLKGLKSGEYRKLTPKEVSQMYVLSQKKN